MSWRTSNFQWPDSGFPIPASFFRWPRLFASYLTPPSWSSSLGLNLSLPDIDDVVWSVVSAVESVALVSFLCFFFVFCGCTI
ncbi:hypothetical protein C2S51_002630 [Perilla frutescens var. frutescens]|nr:hypothetical protein C2S51_002630 [Perilla frutescens var. frutescens]